MEDGVRKSCWVVTLWTVMAFSGLLALGFLSTVPESVALAVGEEPEAVASN